jgi:PEP-CTERM motif
MIPTRIRWAVAWPTAVLACLALSPAARAFFFRGWPGEGVPKVPTLTRPIPTDTDSRPPGVIREPNPDDHTSAPGGGSPNTPVSPAGTPEPGTAVLAALGAGVVALARWRRKRPRV